MNKFLKRFLILIAVIVFLFILFLLTKGVLVSMAKNDFEKGKYENAAQKYKILIILDKKNEKYKYGMADSLVKLPFSYKVQKEICDFLEKYEEKPYAYQLQEKLNKFKAELDWKIGSNYIEKATTNNSIIRWEDDAFPLKVYISGGEGVYVKAVKDAFAYWTYATGNFVSFAYVDDLKDADVKVQILQEAQTNCNKVGCHYVAAVTEPSINKNKILEYMDLKVYTKDPQGNIQDPYQIYEVAAHEIGHVLGIMGHSDNPDDIMYASAQDHEDDFFAEHRNSLTKADINTLNYLYMIVPNVSNIPQERHNTNNKIHPNVILGTTRQIKQREIDDAKNYIKNAPNLALGYINLGNAYLDAEDYKEAMKTYRQAFSLSIDTKEKYIIVYNMALVCLKMGDKKKALEYAQYAKKIYNNEEIDMFIHDIKNPWSVGNTRV